MSETVRSALDIAKRHLEAVLCDETLLAEVEKAGQALAQSFKEGGKAISCGNGGSLCDAMHFAEELTGRFRKDRRPLPAVAISDPSHISCVANDFGFEEVFSRFVQAHGKPGDVLLAISTSGESENVIRACRTAKEQEMAVIALTGSSGSAVGEMADFELAVGSSEFSDRVQEIHIKLIHILIEIVERELVL